MNEEDDPRDPYILGRPMGWKAGTLFLLIMLVIPAIIYGFSDINSPRTPKQTCKARGLSGEPDNPHLCWMSTGDGRYAPVEN